MPPLAKHKLPPDAPDWLVRTTDEARGKIEASPLVQGCAAEDTCGRYTRALFGGFWYFVDAFPGILRETYTTGPASVADERLRRSLQRATHPLTAALSGIEGDERTHRDLWIASARQAGLTEEQLHHWPTLPEVRDLADAMRAEQQLGRRLLYFVAVEIVAGEASRFLSRAPRFVQAMGSEGMLWFAAHLADRKDPGTHTAIAYTLALSIKQALGEPIDEASVSADIQRCVDWFFVASIACVHEFAQ